MSIPLSHFVPDYPSPSPYPQVHSLVGLCLYSRLTPRFFMMFLNPKCLSCWKCSVEKCFYMRKVTAKVRGNYFLLPSYKAVIPIPATSA